MFTRPDLDDRVLVDALAAGWGFAAVTIEYRPVGFGSHHWLAVSAAGDRRFVTVDDLDARLRSAEDTTDAAYERLDAAFRSCRALARAGLDFAVAPLPTLDDGVLYRVADRWSMVTHPLLAGRVVGEYSATDRRAVLDRLAAMHAATDRLDALPPVDDLAVPRRAELVAAIGAPVPPTGPYAERAGALLAAHAPGLLRLFDHLDVLAARVAARPERRVVTHGEPSANNVMTTPDGLRFVDWESALYSAPERDLWELAEDDPDLLDAYPGGIDADALAMYRLWYDLFEIAGYVSLFRAPHGDTADAAESWQNLVHFLRPEERWPALFGG